MDSIKIVDAVVAQDKEAFMSAFNAALATKVTDALEVQKVEIASNLLGTQEEPTTHEVETNTVEVDGSTADADASVTADA